MLSSFPSLRKKQHLTKDQNSLIILLIGICSIFAALLLYLGSQELYKVKTLVIRYCQVTSLGLKYQRHSFFPHWNITMIDENKIKDDFLIESIGTRSERWAWINARKYKVSFRISKLNQFFLVDFRSMKHIHVIVHKMKHLLFSGVGNGINQRN
jgi:hypothetical protein